MKSKSYWQIVKKRLKKEKKRVRNSIDILIRYIKFYSRYYPLSAKNRGIHWIRSKILTFRVLSGVYLIILGMVSYGVGMLIDAAALDPEALTYFTTAGAMVGGIIAIVIPFSLLVMQNAAENSSAGFFRTLGRDRRFDVVLFALIFSVMALFLLGLTAGSYQFSYLKIASQAAIFLIGFDLYLVFLLKEMLFKKINPFSSISLISTSSHAYLDDIHKRATQFAGLMMLHPKTDKNTTKEEMLAAAFQSLRPDLQNLSNELNYLFDYQDKALAKSERTFSLKILEVIASILEKYFVIRKNSSVLLPSGFFFVSISDSQDFIIPHLESLVAVGENYLKRDDAVGVRKVITLFQELVAYAGEIRFVGSRGRDNPILMQCRGYLDQLMKSIILKGFFEGMFQGALSYQAIGIYVIHKKLIHEISPVYETLDKIAYVAIAKRQDVVITRVMDAYTAFLTVLLEERWLVEHWVKQTFEHLQQLVLVGFIASKSRATRDGGLQQDLGKPYETFADLLVRAVQKVPSIRDPRQKRDAKSAILKASEELRASLRELSENMKNADSLLVGVLARTTERVGCLLIDLITDPHWNDEKNELEGQAKWYIHQPKWFTHNVDTIDDNLSYDALPEAVSKMGILAVEKDQDDIVDEATEVISQFATEMLEKEEGSKYGLTEPRIMVLACCIGIYALKKGKTGIIQKLKLRIQAFEDAYKKKFFSNLPPGTNLSSPHEDQLMREVLKFMNKLTDLNRVRDPFMNTEEILIGIISVDDVKKFIKEIWNVKV